MAAAPASGRTGEVRKNPAMHRIAVLALDSVVAFDLAVPAQVFGHDDERERYVLRVCAGEPGPVMSSTGFSIVAGYGSEALAWADTVIVPGVGDRIAACPPAVLDALRAADARGARIVSICTGAFVLAEAGLLDGRRAATHWRDAATLAERRPAVEVDSDVLWVDDGRVLTSAGVAAGIDLCLHLVRQDLGTEHANRIARRMVVAPHRAGGQAQFVEQPVPEPIGDGLGATCAWMLEHLDEPLTVPAMARHAARSERSFARHFRSATGTTPLRWLHEQRVLRARQLLEETALPVEDIARRAGFGTATGLRTHFLRATRTTPTAYRRAFTAGAAPGP
jgi:transcriptional regulator GlxA family with amidase domain